MFAVYDLCGMGGRREEEEEEEEEEISKNARATTGMKPIVVTHDLVGWTWGK